ncbi:MAG: phage holin family protein [Bacteroidales bacterium]|jgi:hypothetical protein|nr:phage holin family protein [Bacteroidales bacterium]
MEEQEKDKSKHPLQTILESSEEYGRDTLDLIRLKAVDKGSKAISSFVLILVFVLILSIFFIMATIGLALWLGEIMGRTCYGFFAVGGFFGITGVIIYFVMGKWLKRVITDIIIRNTLS